jgi:hypothetical protein
MGEVAWFGTELLCGGPKQGNSANRSFDAPSVSKKKGSLRQPAKKR